MTIENFGGSQENLHMIGRNPDKEPAVHVHVGRKDSGNLRTTMQDNLSTALTDALKQDLQPPVEPPPPPPVSENDYSMCVARCYLSIREGYY